jgi:transcription elongation factor Elf1
MDFLNSEECEDMKIDIYNAWIDESTEMNNEEAESIEEDTSW